LCITAGLPYQRKSAAQARRPENGYPRQIGELLLASEYFTKAELDRRKRADALRVQVRRVWVDDLTVYGARKAGIAPVLSPASRPNTFAALVFPVILFRQSPSKMDMDRKPEERNQNMELWIPGGGQCPLNHFISLPVVCYSRSPNCVA